MNMNVTGPVHTDLARIEYASAGQAAHTATQTRENNLHDHLNMQMVVYNPEVLSEHANSFAEKHHCFNDAAKAEMGAFLIALLQHHGIMPHAPPQHHQLQHGQEHHHFPGQAQAHAPAHHPSGEPLSERSQILENNKKQELQEMEHQMQCAEQLAAAQARFKLRKQSLDFMLQNI